MNTNVTNSMPQRSRIHPLIAGAAVSVILASVTGVAAITGILPVSHAVQPPAAQTAPVAVQAASAPLAAVEPATTTAQQTGTVQQTSNAQPVVQQTAPAAPRPVHHAYKPHAAPAPQYANGSDTQSAGTRQVAADPYAGEVVSINPVQTSEPTTGLGAVGGAVAGGLIGNQFGGGHGRILTTIAGAVGGGLAGNGIEHAVRKQTSYQVQVRMQDGSYRNFTYATQPQVQIGQRVHVSGDTLTAS
ncbi:glycine zipper 2TM domain-containing protein [Paraburkholderia sp. Tr-20389]|uniref:glycine zipper 2TM domain-containing protein n=1 Tax=Paraburkholderia sp. Tr-20389 TaxID=2703903 RepID=UPI00198078A2|nr:glycine zipper 2TM domain-containing protein [Paraburkholderia sp. Tr-20389]MBN3758848.1 glycine zipper 2TM domain-containing protein [Paraburkholderia sp. Tr-20389]